MSELNGSFSGGHFNFDVSLDLSGDRFCVAYRIAGDRAWARETARDICVEQTIEFPADLVTDGDIRGHVLGRVESFEERPDGAWEVVISYAVEVASGELTQLLNVMLGNFSLKPGVRVEQLVPCGSLLETFKGPRFGISGLRELTGVRDRPLFCSALKPMGLSASGLADLAYALALGGVDLLKDDHGLTDQVFAPFEERVRLCSGAVERAYRETGKKCLYFPNITGPAHLVAGRARFARDCGAGGVMAAPALVGPDTVRMLAEDDDLGLPIFLHPAFQGSFTVSPDSGISHRALFGQLPRLMGADASIFPNCGGRFSFSTDDCRSIIEGAVAPLGHLRSIFPVPAGGMNLERLPEMMKLYGTDVILLIGGALHKGGPGLVENCRLYMNALSPS